jgi:hypothetical protein
MTPEEARKLANRPEQCHRATPEMRLMSAILDDAIAVYRDPRGDPRRRRQRCREVERWFRSLDRQWPFSFRNVCDALGLDAATVWGRVSGSREKHGLAA